MFRVAKSVCEAVKRAWSRDGLLFGFAAVDKIKQVCFEPALENVRVVGEALKPFRMVEKLLYERLDRLERGAVESTCEALMANAREENG
jgi:hypothetical protein